MVSPPKPPRAHDWKLLVKNTRVTLNQEEDAAGGTLILFEKMCCPVSDQVLKQQVVVLW